jgi:hypothetical protein
MLADEVDEALERRAAVKCPSTWLQTRAIRVREILRIHDPCESDVASEKCDTSLRQWQ